MIDRQDFVSYYYYMKLATYANLSRIFKKRLENMELRKDFTYSLIVPTSMGVRITPVNGQPVNSSDTYIMQATSAETNVASISSYLGLPGVQTCALPISC